MTRENAPERSVQELYRDDPERADALVFGRQRCTLQRPAPAPNQRIGPFRVIAVEFLNRAFRCIFACHGRPPLI